jgi:hypothetical protein
VSVAGMFVNLAWRLRAAPWGTLGACAER